VELILIKSSFWINTGVLLKQKIFKSKVQKLFGPTRKEVTREWRRLATMRLVTRNYYQISLQRKIRSMGHVLCSEAKEMQFLVGIL